MMLKWLSSSVERSLKNLFSWGWVAAFDIRRYISRPSASNAKALRIPSAASPEMTFSFRIRLCSLRNCLIRASWGAEGTLGNLPSFSSSLAIAWISSMCFVSICAKRANTCLANGSALLSAAAVKSRFPSLSNRNARISAPAGPLFFFAGPVFCIFFPPFKKNLSAFFFFWPPPRPLFLPPWAVACREDLLPKADRPRRHLDQFVLVDELDRFLQGHDAGGDQAQRLVGACRADVGEFFLLGRVDVHVHRARILPDDHPLVHALPLPDEQGAPRLEVIEGVRGGPPRAVGDQHSRGPVPDGALPRLVAVEQVVHQPRAPRLGQKLRAETDEPPGGNPVLEPDPPPSRVDHLHHLPPAGPRAP